MSTAVTGHGTIKAIARMPMHIIGAGVECANKAIGLIKIIDAKILAEFEKNRLELENQEFLPTPEGLERKFSCDTQRLLSLIEPFKIDTHKAQEYARIYALETSGLARFLSNADYTNLNEHRLISEKFTQQIVNSALTNFKFQSLNNMKKSIIEAAKENGFSDNILVTENQAGTHIIAINEKGQSIIVLTNSLNSGLSFHADTTGFSPNGQCSEVMHSFISSLGKRNISITKIKEMKHEKEEGILNKYVNQKLKEFSAPINEQNVQLRESKQTFFRRKMNYYFNKTKLFIKN